MINLWRIGSPVAGVAACLPSLTGLDRRVVDVINEAAVIAHKTYQCPLPALMHRGYVTRGEAADVRNDGRNARRFGVQRFQASLPCGIDNLASANESLPCDIDN
ncbi:hypothetical protein Bbelb_057760 [Branchiostoma belcheri]|nr:hypothetical protein Bbelb_057760 [Branchiostoma belcheri]